MYWVDVPCDDCYGKAEGRALAARAATAIFRLNYVSVYAWLRARSRLPRTIIDELCRRQQKQQWR
ncbi:unnamed protein product [Ceratitis capitata]|uniref:(Mediterranean fruit fly) hypothetical protein n=1 Tax=Ceratitis capitata TaxID=7213 RepID=A0A811U414_CERCA|nr:unnamed protein product [Ceratitis capitata]